MQTDKHYRIYWEKTAAESAKILRMSGCSPCITVPAQVAGYPVAEIGDYCFAQDSRLPADGYLTEGPGQPGLSSGPAGGSPQMDSRGDSRNLNAVRELCGSYIQRVCLPDTVAAVGRCAFYNCRNLTQIAFGSRLTGIGSDAFMNCRRLQRLHVRCGPQERSGLRQILNQIPWEVEVSFGPDPSSAHGCSAGVQAAVLYPEYFETYDEIAPAHVFGRRITGEGFRARQSFKDGVIDYAQYDAIFEKACAGESAQTLCRLALCRLRCPVNLSGEMKEKYQTYIKLHGQTLCKRLAAERDLEALSYLFHNRLLLPADAQQAILSAAEAGWTEGSASMCRWKQSYISQPAGRRYEFDDFS